MSSKIIEESTLEHTNVVVAKQPTPPGVCANKTAQCLLLDQLGSAPLIMSYASLSVAILVLGASRYIYLTCLFLCMYFLITCTHLYPISCPF